MSKNSNEVHTDQRSVTAQRVNVDPNAGRFVPRSEARRPGGRRGGAGGGLGRSAEGTEQELSLGMRSTAKPIPQHTWQGFIAYAESFGQAAMYVSDGLSMMHNAPVGALACHCIELSLKAVLLGRGYTAKEVVNFRHNLDKLFKETRHLGLDWSDLDTKAIVFYGRAMLDHAFRYRNSARPYVLDDQHVLQFMQAVFHRCLQAVAPSARRSLRPRPRSKT
jgi:hypothetical protein